MSVRHGLLVACVVVLLGTGSAPMAQREEQKAFFRAAKQDRVWWLITPEGKAFFSLGVDVVDKGQTRAKYRANRPEYAAHRYYPNDAAWAQSALTRLQNWGFNTLGAWGDIAA